MNLFGSFRKGFLLDKLNESILLRNVLVTDMGLLLCMRCATSVCTIRAVRCWNGRPRFYLDTFASKPFIVVPAR